MMGEDIGESHLYMDLLSWLSAIGEDRPLVETGALELSASMILLRLQGLSSSLSGCDEAGDCISALSIVSQVFEHCFEGTIACQLSQLGEDHLFLIRDKPGKVETVMKSLQQSFSNGEFRFPSDFEYLSPRIACSNQKLQIFRIGNRSAPECVPASMDYLQDALDEGQRIRARIILGETFAAELHSPDSYRLIGLVRSDPDSYARGIYEYLDLYSEAENRCLLKNRVFTDRGISAFHAGLYRESRELFFEALQNAPFDPLPGRYLNRIQGQA